MQSTQHSQVSKINRPASPRCFKIKVKNIEKAERSLWPPQTVENLTSTCGLRSANGTISISIKKLFFLLVSSGIQFFGESEFLVLIEYKRLSLNYCISITKIHTF